MTWKICLQGQVQGVGFRPFVWKAAHSKKLNGNVVNGVEGVVIILSCSEAEALDFHEFMIQNAPPLARITHSSLARIPDQFFDTFSIEKSHSQGRPTLLITPDVALCAQCREEVHAPENRRLGYPFTTCTNCGPRFSILNGVPYDRVETTMRRFEMCPNCQAEYASPADRRFFSQTNSCPNCGIEMTLFDAATKLPCLHAQGAMLEAIVTAWKSGKIVAIKGVGGYLLTCDATNPESIATLRARKKRPGKPFAVMYPNVAMLQSDVAMSDGERELLQSAAGPIVLLEMLEKPGSGIQTTGIAPGLGRIGAMLPNAPIFELLLGLFNRPIIATSGNISKTPLEYKDQGALEHLSPLADLILAHNREITMPQDDSVVRMALNGRKTTIRRARGYAPAFIQAGLPVAQKGILTLGAEMKGAFALAHSGVLNISQYLGEMDGFESQERYKLVQNQLLNLYHASPELIVGDLHPEYFTTEYGKTLAHHFGVPFVQIQHHEAHFAAVLAENNLMPAGQEKILGVIWDGAGYGHDGQIWGGEFFICTDNMDSTFQRVAHFAYFPWLLNNKMSKEPRLSALSIGGGLEHAEKLLAPKFSATEWHLYQKMLAQPGSLKSASVGRIFDAVASLLDLADFNGYEGEAALLLEELAWKYCKTQGFANLDAPDSHLFQNQETTGLVQTKWLLQRLLNDLNSGKSKEFVAARFHFLMAKTIFQVAQAYGTTKIAFSGGVFQNALLLEMIEHLTPSNHALFFHRQLSPNDENIAFGQWAHVALFSPRNFNHYVSCNPG